MKSPTYKWFEREREIKRVGRVGKEKKRDGGVEGDRGRKK